MLSECDLSFLLIIFFIKFVCVPYKVATRVTTSVILIMILCDFAADNGLYVYCEFLIIHKRAGVCRDIILLIIISVVFWFFMKLVVPD